MLGSGPIAVPVLEKLYQQSQAGLFELLGAGTQPDRPAGRKRQLMPTPVGAFSFFRRGGIRTLTHVIPERLPHKRRASGDMRFVKRHPLLI